MNEQLQQALAVLIEKAISGIDASVDFMSAELPDVVEQLLMWYAVKGFIFLLVGVALIIAYIVIELKLHRFCSKNLNSVDYQLGYLFLGSFFRLCVILTVSLFINIEWLKIWIAPKVWLIEYASKIAS